MILEQLLNEESVEIKNNKMPVLWVMYVFIAQAFY